jgi:hypothetical protein
MTATVPVARLAPSSRLYAPNAKGMGQLLGQISVDRSVSITADPRTEGLLAIWRAVCDPRQPAAWAERYLWTRTVFGYYQATAGRTGGSQRRVRRPRQRWRVTRR